MTSLHAPHLAAGLAYTRTGSGEAVVLLHGLGSSRRAWSRVTPLLAGQFDVIALDLPGFGESPALPDNVEPCPSVLAALVGKSLHALGVDNAHVVGNSLGGWVALELAALMPVRTLTLLSPAGLWRDETPLYCRISLRVCRLFARWGELPARWLVRNQVARTLLLRQILGRPGAMTADEAEQMIRDMGECRGFGPTLRAVRRRRYTAATTPSVPVSVSFGTRDLMLLRKQSRQFHELPPQTRVWALPGTGHVPMTDDAAAVAALIRCTATENRLGGQPLGPHVPPSTPAPERQSPQP